MKNFYNDLVFFGKEGLTSTSADSVASKAKEYISNIELKISKLSFIDETVEINGTKKKVKNGSSLASLHEIHEKHIKTIYEVKTLIAWLREAIKAKEMMYSKIEENYTYEKFLKEHGYEDNGYPNADQSPTEEDIVREWDADKRLKYYSLETKCSVIGKVIHQNSPLSEARKEIIDSQYYPSRVETMNDTIVVYDMTPSIRIEELDEIFFKLHNKHREYESELNKMKFEIKSEISKRTNEINEKYLKAVNDYHMNNKKMYDEYLAELSKKKSDAIALRIIIPDKLKPTYDLINSI